MTRILNFLYTSAVSEEGDQLNIKSIIRFFLIFEAQVLKVMIALTR